MGALDKAGSFCLGRVGEGLTKDAGKFTWGKNIRDLSKSPISKSFKYFILFNPSDNPEEGILWLHFTNENTQAQEIFLSERQRQRQKQEPGLPDSSP